MDPTLLYTSLPHSLPVPPNLLHEFQPIYNPVPQKPTYFLQAQDHPPAWRININEAQIEYSHPKHTVHLHDS